MTNDKKHIPTIIYFFALAFVIIIWGLDPIVLSELFKHYSATALNVIFTFGSAVLFLVISIVRKAKITKELILISIPISIISSVAMMMQRIGLQYTTPSSYAFLEHLSCVATPAAVFFFAKKKPCSSEVIAALVCLIGCFIFCGTNAQELGGGIGNLLCSGAGILVGISTAATALYASKLDTTLFVTIYMWIYFISSVIGAIVLNELSIGNAPLEAFRFTFEPLPLILSLSFGLISIGICWLCRTFALKGINPITVAVVSPVSAILAGAISIFMGTDKLTVNFAVGALLISLATIIPTLWEIAIKLYNQHCKDSVKKIDEN